MSFTIKGAAGSILAVAALAATAGSASAETYTLDGAAAGSARPAGEQVVCSAIPAQDGSTPCFSSEAVRDTSVRSSLRAGKVPAGFGAVPSAARQSRLLGTPTAAAARKSGAKAHAAATCPRDYNNVWTGGNYNDDHDYFGYTGYTFYNFSGYFSPGSRGVTSYKNADYSVGFNDASHGTGNYYPRPGGSCYAQNSLADNDPSWNNRFYSFTAL